MTNMLQFHPDDSYDVTQRVEPTPRPLAARQRVFCYAHRGARAHAPENTLLAFELAFDLGADGIECDVQRSKDGGLLIIHDSSLDRTTNGKGSIRARTLDELRALDASRGWNLPQPQRIPTLAETLALVQRRGGALNLEIKGESVEDAVATAELVAPVLRGLDESLRRRVLVSSFEHPSLELLKRQLPWARVGVLYGGLNWRRRDMLAIARALDAEAIHPGARLATHKLVRRAHESGLQINVWTTNRPRVIRELVAWGVDGLVSDFPERVIIARSVMAPDEKHAALAQELEHDD